MSTYSIKDYEATAAYAVSVLDAIACGDYTAYMGICETPEEYAQRHLDAMVAEGSIEVES